MTNRDRLEEAGWKFMVKKRGADGMWVCIYEDPKTGRMHSQRTAMEMLRQAERAKKWRRLQAQKQEAKN